MSKVYREDQIFSMAWLKEDNPLPDLKPAVGEIDKSGWDSSLTEEDTRYFSFGRVNSILPYLAQDNYDRDRKDQKRPVIVLENDRVRAEFLPWMGGRLWSLKKDGRELLCHNPVVQPCNLALRNAWCSGGVEWNIGIRGHHMMTCSTMFTELLSLPDGTAGVRFYEFERLRGVVYRVEAYLPPESALLFVQVTIENPRGNGETPMYWWSNIAVPETQKTRVLAPAKEAITTLYKEKRYVVARCPMPMHEGVDASYPTNLNHAIDFFYVIPPEKRKFITALQGDHHGLVQFSTDRLLGRKLFVWGMNAGGRHWQEFLADEHTAYIEIQAGIVRTQNEHIPMPENTAWSWLEGYGELTCDITGLDYETAIDRAESALNELYPHSALLNEQKTRAAEISRAHGEIVFSGSGWGALENAWRVKNGLGELSAVCRFPESSMGDGQAPWLALLSGGSFPSGSPETAPDGYMISAHWRDLLEKSEKEGWAGYYQLGVARCAAGDTGLGREALRESVARAANPWALSALAELEKMDGRMDEALGYWKAALRLLPEERAIFLKYGGALLSEKKYQILLDEIYALEGLRHLPRVLSLEAAALIGLSRFDEARAILLRPLIIPDMQEGELSLGELWDTLHMKEHGITREEARAAYPLPRDIDFRMH